MVIRKVVMGDLENLAILFDNYRQFYKKEADIIGAGIFIRDRILNNDSEIFVSENDDKVITGFVQLYPLFSSTRMKRLWLLNDLYIDEKFRGNGYSDMLVNECKKLCRQTNSCGMILETAKSNFIGNNLYIKTGFLPDKDHNYYEWEIEST